MAVPTTWDVRIVNLASDALSVVAYIPQWDSCEFSDTVNDFGHGSVSFNRDSPWVDEFYTANSNVYPWEGNYGVQIVRSGVVAYTFIIEETEIQYVGPQRRVALGGRGLAACLTWAVVLPEGFDESNADPDAPDEVLQMGRGFGNTHDTQAELDAGTYSVDNPKYKAYGGGAFVHLFTEADTGNAGSWANVTTAQASRNGGSVTWPLSLDSSMSRTNDANGTAWSSTGTYPSADITWLFEISSGMNMHDVLLECCSLQANAQWNVTPTGEISIANSIGVNRSSTVLLTVPQSQGSTNSLRNTDTRSRLYASNGYLFESESDATATTRFGRREGYLEADQTKGETVTEIVKHGLEEIKGELDEFTFAYTETDVTRAFVDFQVSDSVSIEYEPGVVQARQITGLGASISAQGAQIEVVVGDMVENAIAVLEKKSKNEQYSALISTRQKDADSRLDPPSITSVTPRREGVARSATLAFKTPGWADASGADKGAASLAQVVSHYEGEVYLTSSSSTRHKTSKSIDRTQTAQEMTVTGLGTKDGSYTARVRAVRQDGRSSNWATTSFTMTESGEGGPSDPYKPGQIAQTSIQCFPMLNGILVKFTDFTTSTNPTLQGNRGKYEIQVSNNPASLRNPITEPSSWTSGNIWTRTITGDDSVSHTAGETGSGAKTFRVPDGSGFICTGLYSDAGMPANTEIFQPNGSSYSPARYWEPYVPYSAGPPEVLEQGHPQYGAGRLHYVRVRAINWDGTAGDWSEAVGTSTAHWALLDTNNEAQVGVWLGEDTIAASHVMAGTLTAAQIKSGSITTDRLDADQVITSEIRLPQPAGATDGGTGVSGGVGSERKFTIANNGDVWWGNYASFTDAVNRNPISGTVDDDDVLNRIKGDGTETSFGTPNSYMQYATHYSISGLWTNNLYTFGNTNLYGPLKVTGATAEVTAGSGDQFKIKNDGTIYMGSTTTGEGRIRIKPSSTNFLFSGSAIEFVASETHTGSSYGWIQGGAWDIDSPFNLSVVGAAIGSGASTSNGITYMGVFDPTLSSSSMAGIVLNSPDKPIQLNAVNDGIYIPNRTGAASTVNNQLSAYGGDLYWASGGTATQLNGGGGSGDYTWNVNVWGGTANEVEDGDTITFKGLGIASTSMGGDTVNITATKDITSFTDTGRRGTVITSGTATSTGVNFQLLDVTSSSLWDDSNSYVMYGISAFGTNYQYKTTVDQFATRIAANSAMSAFLKDQSTTVANPYVFANLQVSGNIWGTGGSHHFYNASSSGFQINTLGTVLYRAGSVAQYNYTASNVMYQITRPVSDNTYTLGGSSYRWSTTYTVAVSTSSDQALKTDIADEVKGVDFLKTLRPVTFKWKDTTDEITSEHRAGARFHHGFIAQEVETALGADATNDGLWYNGYHPAVEEHKDVNPDGDEIVLIEGQDESYNPGLRYLEFMGPIVKAIQELAARVEALEGG
jgi:hypothetical protein